MTNIDKELREKIRGKHFITLQDWEKDEIDALLAVSDELKERFGKGEVIDSLKNQTLFMMFFEQSTRTRNSMEAGITQLGGHGHFLDTSTMQISHGESAKDTAVILSRYGHAIACRNCFWEIGNNYLNDMARWSTRPVINMQCDKYHPLQALADLMTMREKLKSLQGKKVSIIWAYATSHKKPISVPLSQILLFPRYGMDVTLAHPKGYDLPHWALEKAEKYASDNGGKFQVTDDQDDAYSEAQIVIPKNWGNWVADQNDFSANDLPVENRSWKCTAEKMSLTDEALYMHALPADRGNEVDDEIIDGKQSIVYDEAENRLHTSKAIMSLTMNTQPTD